MDDRELLELAAFAAGVKLGDWTECGVHRGYEVSAGDRPNGICWNPLNDDGDAFRLAVTLGMEVTIGNGVAYVSKLGFQNHQLSEWRDGDICATTRRAIVRVAAEIGKATL